MRFWALPDKTICPPPVSVPVAVFRMMSLLLPTELSVMVPVLLITPSRDSTWLLSSCTVPELVTEPLVAPSSVPVPELISIWPPFELVTMPPRSVAPLRKTTAPAPTAFTTPPDESSITVLLSTTRPPVPVSSITPAFTTIWLSVSITSDALPVPSITPCRLVDEGKRAVADADLARAGNHVVDVHQGLYGGTPVDAVSGRNRTA